MPLVKRYPNRKLYDTEAKRYVSLEGIAALIRQGAEVQVVDHASGEDITNLILAQIIAEQERKQSGVVPQSVLAGLIQAGEQTLAAVRRGMSESLDFLRQVDEEIERRVQMLVERGLLEQEEGRRLAAELGVPDAASVSGAPERATDDAHPIPGVPMRGDVKRLSDQLDLLSAQLDALAARDEPADGP